MIQCRLWKSLNDAGTADPPFQEFREVLNEACPLYLYNGQTQLQPYVRSKRVAFSIPKAGTLYGLLSFKGHIEFYLPNWTFEELKLANDALGLNLTEQVLQHRCAVFGGTARYNLTNDLEMVQRGMDKVKEVLDTITTVDHVRQCFANLMDLDLVLMHYKVDDRNWMKATVEPATKQISYMMYKRLSKPLSSDRQMLSKWLDNL